MERRELLKIGSLLLLVPVGRVLTACGSSGPASLSFTSTSEDGHTHSVSLLVSEVETPPSNGVTETTSTSLSHTHVVSLSEAELSSIDAGTTVTKETTEVSGHTHSFSFVRA